MLSWLCEMIQFLAFYSKNIHVMHNWERGAEQQTLEGRIYYSTSNVTDNVFLYLS